MANILGVGIAALDVINVVERYPDEDDEIRALAQYTVRGGNVTNTATVLSQFGHRCEWAGTSCNEPDSALIEADLSKHCIGTKYVRRFSSGKVPTSYITSSQATGSRTIVHFRDLPEYSFEDFRKIPLREFDWIHFEGRAIEETARMLQHARAVAPTTPISLEVEKPRKDIESIFSIPDFIFFSRHYAQAKSFHDARNLLHGMTLLAPKADLICAWGNLGAYALSPKQPEVIHIPAYNAGEIVDTIGAGDTLNAGVIHGLVSGKTLSDSLAIGVKLAGIKCCQTGYEDLAKYV